MRVGRVQSIFDRWIKPYAHRDASIHVGDTNHDTTSVIMSDPVENVLVDFATGRTIATPHSELVRRIVQPRKIEYGPFVLTEVDAERRREEAAGATGLLMPLSPKKKGYKTEAKIACWLVSELRNRLPQEEILLTVMDMGRPESFRVMAYVTMQLLYRQQECPRALRWWSPPLSEVGLGILVFCVGAPDLVYVTEGLDMGYMTGGVVAEDGAIVFPEGRSAQNPVVSVSWK